MNNYRGISDCNCGLNDQDGVTTLKSLHEKKGDEGGLTFIEKIIHNPVALSVGFCVGASAGYFLLPKRKGKGKK